jgi:uncharacterized protein
MTIDVKPLLRGEVNCINLDYTLPIELGGVKFEEEARVVGEIIDRAGYMRLTLKLSVPYVAECARCLDEVRGVFEEDFERTVVTKGSVSDEQLDESVDEYAVLNENGELDVDEEVVETVVLAFPKKHLCDEECPGLCSVCGKRKKEGDCGCVKKEIDPRWAVLKNLLDN